MISLLCIPPELIRSRLVPFLDLQSCVGLDSVVLSKNVRPNWLEGLTFALLVEPRIAVEKDTLSWIKERHLRLVDIEMLGSIADSDVVGCGEFLLNELLTVRINSCQNITDVGVAAILQHSTILQKLIFEHCHQITPAGLRDVRPHSLKELHFIDCSTLDDATFTELIVNCPNLEIIRITGCDKLTDISVRTLACICTKLKEFQFRIEGSMTMQSVRYLAQNCAELRKIVDTYVFDSLVNELHDPSYNDVLIELAQSCPLLEHVELQAPCLTNEQLILFAHHCPHLHTFAIGINTTIDHMGIAGLVANCPLLTHLNLSYVANCQDLGVRAIAEHCTNLQTLKLSDMNNPSASILTTMWKANPNLQTLVLEAFMLDRPLSLTVPASMGITSLTHLDVTETNIAHTSLINLFPYCPALQYLNMTLTNNVSPEVLASLGRYCPSLHTLLLAQCTSVETAALLALAEHCITLITLKLGGTKATDQGLAAIIAQNTKLEFLDLSWCSNMTDITINALSKSCVNLHTLKLKYAKISDTAFCNVVQRCHQLRKLSLLGCTFITLECITLLVQHNRKLQDLSVSSSEHLTDTVFRVLSQYCPFLRRVEILDCLNVAGLVVPDMVAQYKGQLVANVRMRR